MTHTTSGETMTFEQLREIINCIDDSETMTATAHPDCDALIKLIDLDDWHKVRDWFYAHIAARQSSCVACEGSPAVGNNPCALCGQQRESSSGDGEDAMEYLRTHEGKIRLAMCLARKLAAILPPDIDDASLWDHELAALDAAMQEKSHD